MAERDTPEIRGWEFVRLIRAILPLALEGKTDFHILDESGEGADFVVRQGDARVIVEVKSVTPQTRARAEAFAQQVTEYRRHYEKQQRVRAIIAVPGIVSEPFTEPFRRRNIEIWDRPVINDYLNQLRRDVWPEDIARVANELLYRPQKALPTERLFADQLRRMPCGRPSAYQYQNLCSNILEFLFHPPLEKALTESRNDSGVNRRDIILPNYASDGFWKFMRDSYQADFVVVDAKNLCGGVRKVDVLQLAHYLAEHGTGLFGMLLTRTGSERSAEIIRREQWVLHRKLIVILNDDDLHQMLVSASGGDSPEAAIRQKIEAFRLGF